jgi:hypothetical protein
MIWFKVLEAMKAVAKKFGVVVSTTFFFKIFFMAKHYFEKNKVIIFWHN